MSNEKCNETNPLRCQQQSTINNQQSTPQSPQDMQQLQFLQIFPSHLLPKKHFQTSWVSIYMSFFRLQKSIKDVVSDSVAYHPTPPLPGGPSFHPQNACANAR